MNQYPLSYAYNNKMGYSKRADGSNDNDNNDDDDDDDDDDPDPDIVPPGMSFLPLPDNNNGGGGSEEE